MKVLLKPIRSEKPPFEYIFENETIYIDGEEYDFSKFKEDGELENPPYPIRKVERINGELYVVLVNRYQWIREEVKNDNGETETIKKPTINESEVYNPSWKEVDEDGELIEMENEGTDTDGEVEESENKED